MTSDTFSWVPDVKEFILFFISMVLIILLSRLFHHNRVQKIIRKTSRCLREKRIGQRGGVYSVSAYTKNNEPMYTVSYSLKDKTTRLDCACKKGTVSNTFETKLYNIRDPTAGTKRVEQVCLCDSQLTQNPTYYSGYPALIRYMYSDDVSFFDYALDPDRS